MRAVAEAFVTSTSGADLPGEYMVNWSPSLGTAVLDLEVEYSEEEGKLYYFKYNLDEAAPPPVATRGRAILARAVAPPGGRGSSTWWEGGRGSSGGRCP